MFVESGECHSGEVRAIEHNGNVLRERVAWVRNADVRNIQEHDITPPVHDLMLARIVYHPDRGASLPSADRG